MVGSEQLDISAGFAPLLQASNLDHFPSQSPARRTSHKLSFAPFSAGGAKAQLKEAATAVVNDTAKQSPTLSPTGVTLAIQTLEIPDNVRPDCAGFRGGKGIGPQLSTSPRKVHLQFSFPEEIRHDFNFSEVGGAFSEVGGAPMLPDLGARLLHLDANRRRRKDLGTTPVGYLQAMREREKLWTTRDQDASARDSRPVDPRNSLILAKGVTGVHLGPRPNSVLHTISDVSRRRLSTCINVQKKIERLLEERTDIFPKHGSGQAIVLGTAHLCTGQNMESQDNHGIPDDFQVIGGKAHIETLCKKGVEIRESASRETREASIASRGVSREAAHRNLSRELSALSSRPPTRETFSTTSSILFRQDQQQLQRNALTFSLVQTPSANSSRPASVISCCTTPESSKVQVLPRESRDRHLLRETSRCSVTAQGSRIEKLNPHHKEVSERSRSLERAVFEGESLEREVSPDSMFKQRVDVQENREDRASVADDGHRGASRPKVANSISPW